MTRTRTHCRLEKGSQSVIAHLPSRRLPHPGRPQRRDPSRLPEGLFAVATDDDARKRHHRCHRLDGGGYDDWCRVSSRSSRHGAVPLKHGEHRFLHGPMEALRHVLRILILILTLRAGSTSTLYSEQTLPLSKPTRLCHHTPHSTKIEPEYSLSLTSLDSLKGAAI